MAEPTGGALNDTPKDRGTHNSDDHTHAQDHAHPHRHVHAHNHVGSGDGQTSRRDFLRVLMGSALAGASILELAYHRAAWARAAAPNSDAKLFDLQKAANGVYFPHTP